MIKEGLIEELLNAQEWNQFTITNSAGNKTIGDFPDNFIPKFAINGILDRLFEGVDDLIYISGSEMIDKLNELFDALGIELMETRKILDENPSPDTFLKVSKIIRLINIVHHMVELTPNIYTMNMEE